MAPVSPSLFSMKDLSMPNPLSPVSERGFKGNP